MALSPDEVNDSAPFLRGLCAANPELVAELAAVDEAVVTRECSTGVEDCRLLYLFTRVFRPKRILEIGTFVGSTSNAMALACARNGDGATITTVDFDSSNYDVPEKFASIVTKEQGFSDDVLARLDGVFDLIFVDAEMKPKTVELLNRRVSPDSVFVTHDFTFESEEALDKGVRAAVLMMEGYRPPLEWFIPSPKLREDKWKPVDADGVAVSACCAFGIPPARLEKLGLDFERGREKLPALEQLPPERVHHYRHRRATVQFVELDDGAMAYWGHQTRHRGGWLRRLFG